MPFSTPSPAVMRAIRPAIAAVALVAMSLIVAAQEDESGAARPSAPTLEPFCVLPESYEMRPDVFVLVPGARRVGFSLFRETEIGLEAYTRSELRERNLDWPTCFTKGCEAATRVLQTLEPKFYRDGQKTILYAHLNSENQLTASVFISPKFLDLFKNSLGKELYVAVPDRSNVFVFPKLSTSIEAIAPKMAVLYKEALYPVSREVFEISRDGIRVIGKF
ncbi:MAG: hypothetical protein ACR2RV_28980 [Verrucomicrobiales bacterium]